METFQSIYFWKKETNSLSIGNESRKASGLVNLRSVNRSLNLIFLGSSVTPACKVPSINALKSLIFLRWKFKCPAYNNLQIFWSDLSLLLRMISELIDYRFLLRKYLIFLMNLSEVETLNMNLNPSNRLSRKHFVLVGSSIFFGEFLIPILVYICIPSFLNEPN